ncbi:hypothetical protein SAMN06298216_3538 [Spirosomataceae bacterium TFI 002]|nr:hypothetical protein SAMN06298216_3538 [Spirosomataceae bacterium TFI 002]
MEKSKVNSGQKIVSQSLVKKVLETDDELQIFQSYYHEQGDVHVELPYLQRADKVVIFTDSQDQWMGGYVINSEKLRYLAPFSQNTVNKMVEESGIDLSDTVEITCIWNSRILRTIDKMARYEIYNNAVIDSVRTRKKFLIGGSVIKSVWEQFIIALPFTLYFGPVEVGGEIKNGRILYNNSNEVLKLISEQFRKQRLIRS